MNNEQLGKIARDEAEKMRNNQYVIAINSVYIKNDYFITEDLPDKVRVDCTNILFNRN